MVDLAVFEATCSVSNEHRGTDAEEGAFFEHRIVVETSHRVLLAIVGEAPRWAPAVGVLPSDSPRGIPRRVVMSRDSPRSERDGARNTRI